MKLSVLNILLSKKGNFIEKIIFVKIANEKMAKTVLFGIDKFKQSGYDTF